MSKPESGLFSGTQGAQNMQSLPKKAVRTSPFTSAGHVSISGLKKFREHFMHKSITEIKKMLRDNGYEISSRKSIHENSNAQIITISNGSKQRNISQVQVSPGGGRHGNLPYVKISTKDIGKVKIISGKRKDYKTDGNEKATLIFERRKKKHD